MRLGKVSLFIIFLATNPVFSHSENAPSQQLAQNHPNFSAKVIRIMDGDTMEVLYQSQPIKVRLAHIDCPEKRNSQPFGNNAKQALSHLCFGETVEIEGKNYDRYKRLIAVVFNKKDQNINQEMVKLGMAWHYKKYSKDNSYAELETIARRKKIGLWKDENPIAPWAWRKPRTSKSLIFK